MMASKALELEDNPPKAMRLIAASLCDNFLNNMIQKSRDQGHDTLLEYLLEEKKKRGL